MHLRAPVKSDSIKVFFEMNKIFENVRDSSLISKIVKSALSAFFVNKPDLDFIGAFIWDQRRSSHIENMPL